MESVPPLRVFGYALLATVVAFGVWITTFDDADGIWILIGAIALFSVLAFIDGLLAGRIRRNGEDDERLVD